MKKAVVFASAILLLVGVLGLLSFNLKENTETNVDFSGKTIDLKSSDGLNIKADLYEIEDDTAPVIILFHQAGFSRGEYRPIAPKLNELGFTCLAIDQRSGKEVNGVVNETHKEAVKMDKPTEYTDAFPDLEAALLYVKNNYPNRKIIIWGSSYSSSLVFPLAQMNKSDISGIVSFSPSEYFKFKGKKIGEYAREIECPVFISSARSEHIRWKEISEQIPSKDKVGYLPEVESIHGSRALWEINEGHEKCWEAIKSFLTEIKIAR